jgi:glyoxylase-like metal-dependent hydrolase (beta-lactamase superfamily II)
MIFRQLFDPTSKTYTYLLADEASREAVVIDPVRERVDDTIAELERLGLTLLYTLDTHVHADHVTGAGVLRQRLGALTVVGAAAGVQCADIEVEDGQIIHFGRYGLEARATPGHTAGCTTFVTTDKTMAFTGDTLLIGRCGRTDFQQGDAALLYRSIHERIFVLPDSTEVYPGHDYAGNTVSTVGAEKTHNIRLTGRTETEFVAVMDGLDLAYPKQLDVALPANQRCGAAIDLPIERDGAGTPEVDPAWVATHRAELRFVDVRGEQEFAGELGQAKGAQCVPLQVLGAAARDWDRDEPVAVICRGGHRSGVAARTLETMGFTRVGSVRGGMLAWNARRLPGGATSVGV